VSLKRRGRLLNLERNHHAAALQVQFVELVVEVMLGEPYQDRSGVHAEAAEQDPDQV
jgi:hypothetical protein